MNIEYQFLIKTQKYMILLLGLYLLTACKLNDNSVIGGDKPKVNENNPTAELKKVKVMVAEKRVFETSILSNGKLLAARKADLKFPVEGNIIKLLVKNGDYVKQGQLIASLEDFIYRIKVQQAQEVYERAEVEMQDILLNLGYKQSDTLSVPPNIQTTVELKSGLKKAKIDLELTEWELAATQIFAPFSGKIADVEAREFGYTQDFEKVCSILDMNQLKVSYKLLESEYSYIKRNTKTAIIPINTQDTLIGRTIEINPRADENGMISAMALLDNKKYGLIEGMNVKVLVSQSIQAQLIVPKQAIVLRQNQQVVFTYKNGLSIWNYVKIGDENEDTSVILEGISVGDSVIYEGNILLAHKTPVSLRE